MGEPIRLQKYLADQGIASRRKCEEYIKQGQVNVNGCIAELGMKITPGKDTVEFRDRVIESNEKQNVYILLNKPIRICNNS